MYFHRAVIEREGVVVDAATSVDGSRVAKVVIEFGVAPKTLKEWFVDKEVVVNMLHGDGFFFIAIFGVGEAAL